MWDLVYPASCVHCDSSLIRKHPFTSSFVPFFCSSCQSLMLQQGRIKIEGSKELFYQGFLVHSLFSFNSPLYSLYTHKQFQSKAYRQFLASILVLLFKESLFNREGITFFLMPSKKECLRTHKSSFFSLYQTMKHEFVHDVVPIYSHLNSEVRQGSDWFYKERRPQGSHSLLIFLERFKKGDQERMSQFCIHLKKEYGLSVNYQLYALFA